MKIVIDGRMINESGIGRYLRNLIEELQELDKTNEYYILHLRSEHDRLDYHVKGFHKVLGDFRWYTVAEQIKLPKILNSLKPDLVHFPHFNIPIFYTGKFVVTIHDLIHQHYSMSHASTHGAFIFWAKKFGYRKVFEAAVKKSEKILVPSKFVKDQLLDEWGVDKTKIVVTPEGVDAKLYTIVNTLAQKKMNLMPPYIFYVGNAHPHKNLDILVAAFLLMRRRYPGLKLVFSGKENYFWRKMKTKYNDKDIIYTGFVSDNELVGLYKNAGCFILPSLEEGFGLPVLEAFAIGCPVVASDTGSLKEVGGDAAVYFRSNDVEDLVTKVVEVLDNEKLRQDLIEKGKKRVKQFSWKKLAEQTLEVYHQCVWP